MLRLPDSDAKWSAIAAVVAAMKTAGYAHLPPQEQLKLPVDRATGDRELTGDWELAAERAREGYEVLRAEIERLGPSMRRQPAAAPAPDGLNEVLSSVETDARDNYLATREVADPSGDDIYRYAAGNLDALRRAERLAAGQRWTRVTPGYSWWIDRADDAGRREIAKITLTVGADGAAQLRCGDKLTPATTTHWAELTQGALPPRPRVASEPHQEPHRATHRLLAALRLLLSGDFWFVFLLLALVVSVGVAVVMVLLKL
ncbi:MAG: hypothetical protein HOV67_09355 [Kribbellaceae bacterium]|nr:hypothetical protein [Kribbellaceae bacterium]